MKSASLTVPVALIVLGAIWLLKATGFMPSTAVFVSIGLAVLGVLIVLFDGLNKQSVVTGPLCAYAGAAIYAYTQLGVARSIILALGLMLLGALLLMARSQLIAPKQPYLPPR